MGYMDPLSQRPKIYARKSRWT